jgi:hypothetical protein
MHSHVAQDTPDHHDQQLLATDTDGVLLRRRHPIKLAVVGLAMVTLLGAAGCGAASGQDDGSGGADDGSGGGSREPVTVVEKTVIVKEEARDAGQGSGGVGARGATQQDDQGDDRGTGQGHDQSDDQANDRSDNRDDEQGDDRDDNRGEDDLNDRGDDQGNDLDDDRDDSGDDLDD